MRNRLAIKHRVRNALVHFVDGKGVVYSSGNSIYRLQDLDVLEPDLVASIPWRFWQLPSHLRFLDRALKNGILQVHRNEEAGLLVTTGSRWWHVDRDSMVRLVTPPGLTRPMSRGICHSHGGMTYVADYIDNPGRGPVRVYRTRDLQEFEVCWEFDAGEIRHVHALLQSRLHPERIWVLTGDEDHECGIWYTEDGFTTLRSFLRAGQASRAADLLELEDKLVWGMDSPDETSFLLRCSISESGAEPERLFELPGPCYYAARNEAGAQYFGTTVEKGKAVRDKNGHIIASSPDGTWSDIHRAQKDLVPQQGIFYFPRGILPKNRLVFSQRALKPYEGCMTIASDSAWG